MQQRAICLMGPTASGKTAYAIGLCKRFPCDIISVDSALVYRGMDIGTAKPDAATLQRAPHRLIDIRDPEQAYSAGDFVSDARREMQRIWAQGRLPLLVGGTMMYFRALTGGLAELPPADASVRADIDREAAQLGWPALHAQLAAADPGAAARINPNDSQRIQRALEVQRISGRPLSDLHAQADAAAGQVSFIKIALLPAERAMLHQRIEQRLDEMLAAGLIAEVEGLMRRPGLSPALPSMRAVGYRQFWAHLAGETSLDEARYRTLVATRQLAKRQFTWLRRETGLAGFDPLESRGIESISKHLIGELTAN